MRRFATMALLLLLVAAGVYWLFNARGVAIEPNGAADENSATSAQPSAAGAARGVDPETARGDVVPPKSAAPPAPCNGGAAALPPAAVDAEPAIEFKGIVVDGKEQPVAKASVSLAVAIGGDGSVDATAVPAAITGADGRFSITGPKGAREGRVNARAAGLAPARPDTAVKAGAEARIVMVAACSVRVRVVKEGSDAGVPGVRVYGFGGSNPEWSAWASSAQLALAVDQGTTDGAGLVTLATPGGPAALLAVAEDGSTGRAPEFLVGAEGIDRVVELRSVGTILGTVVDPAGAPVAGAGVLAYGDAGYVRETKTASDGTFRFDGARASDSPRPEDQTQVTVVANGFPGRQQFVQAPEPGGIRKVSIALAAWAKVEGKVVKSDGSPAAGARVIASESAQSPAGREALDPRFTATTGADGSFRVDTAPPDPASYLFATLEGSDGVSTATFVLRSVNPEEQAVILRLSAPSPALRGAIRVHVVDAAGAALANTLLEAGVMHEENSLLGTFHTTTTDADGKATIENLAAGRILLIVHPADGPTVAIPLEPAAGSKVTEVRLPHGEVSGRVLRLDGTPAEIGVRLELVLRSSGGTDTQFGGWGRARTDRDGNFRYEGVGDGDYRLVPDSPAETWVGLVDRAHVGDYLRLVVATAAEEASLHLEAEWIDAGANRPVDANYGFSVDSHPEVVVLGDPAAHEPGLEVLMGSVSGSPGLWRSIYSIVPGSYDAVARVAGYREAKAFGVRIPDGSRAARLRQRLEPAGRVEGTVTASDGKPLGGRVEVRVNDRVAVVRADGGYSLAVPFERNVEVSVVGDHVRHTLDRVDVPREGAARVDFVVERGGAMLVRLPDGQVPKTGVKVLLRKIDLGPGEGSYMTGIDLDRAWLAAHAPSRTLQGLPAGRYRATPSWDGTALPELDVVVRDGETATLDVHAP